jgi:ribosomal-protein-alanine N-acetyltransferase
MFFNQKDHLGDKIFKRFPYIQIDDELLLRDVRLSDANEYYKYINHPLVKKYIPDSCIPQSVAQAEKELSFFRGLHEKRISVFWTIAEKETGKMIGACGFERWTRFHKRLEIAYDINPDHWRKKVATRAIGAIINYGFKEMKAERIEAFLEPSNAPSAGLLLKLGFTKEASLRKYRFFKGKHIDIDLYSIVKDEWK